jgi:predicted transposase/invertase (TIGR01784 family)
VIHIEIQLQVTPETRDRIVFYDAKLITEQLGSGDRYEAIQKVISIIITEDKLIKKSPVYHHRFIFYDPEACVEFSDIIEIHTLELKKLPKNADGTELYDWAKFIAAAPNKVLRLAV